MISSIKKFFYLNLTEQQYLRLSHRAFYYLYRLRLLRFLRSYKFHYLIRKLIKPDDVVLDIGANLGYFMRNFCQLTPKGKVIGVEPLPQYCAILDYFLRNYHNAEVHNFALGKQRTKATMVRPKENGVIRTGLPFIIEEGKSFEADIQQEVEMACAKDFFNRFERIDYIKCDVEGYEWEIFSNIGDWLKTNRPLIQIELTQKTKKVIFEYFENLGYHAFGADQKLNIFPLAFNETYEGDFLFFPLEKVNSFLPSMGEQLEDYSLVNAA